MFIEIYGNNKCSYCIKAKELVEKITKNNNIQYIYIDINKNKISKESLSKKTGKKIKTLPQIFINNQHIGGYKDFYNYCKKIKII